MLKLEKIQTILLDGDGVLWKSTDPIPGIQEFIQFLEQNKIQWALLTNNNTHTVKTYVNKLAGFGIQIDPARIFTSSTVTAEHIKKKFGPGAPIYVVGMNGLLDTLAEAGLTVFTGETPPPTEVVAVAAGMDREITHEKIKIAMRLILNGAEFIATNTDGSFPTPEGLNPGTGMVIGAIQATTGVKPTVIGKPKEAIFLSALQFFNTLPESTLMVGDRLETDILGALRLGIQTAAVLSGVTSRAQIAQSNIKPDLVYEDIADLHLDMQKRLADSKNAPASSSI